LFVLYHAVIRMIKSRLMNFTGHSNCRTKDWWTFYNSGAEGSVALSENGSLFSTA